jgi:hypothetical protein
VRVIELEPPGREQQVDEAMALLQLDHLVESRIHGVGQRPGTKDLVGRLDLVEIDLERRLAFRLSICCHTNSHRAGQRASRSGGRLAAANAAPTAHPDPAVLARQSPTVHHFDGDIEHLFGVGGGT